MGALRRLKLPFRLLCPTTDFAPDHHPDFWTWQTITRQHSAQYEKIGDQGTFVPLKPPKPLPSGRGPLPGQFLHRHFGRARGMQTLAPGGGSFTRAGLGRHPPAWTPTFPLPIGFAQGPDLGVPRNLRQVPQSRPSQAFQEGGRVAISLVAHHPARFEPPVSHDLLDQLCCQLLLGLCRRVRRESDTPATVVGAPKPTRTRADRDAGQVTSLPCGWHPPERLRPGSDPIEPVFPHHWGATPTA
jgi:hypothetical protein